MKMQAGALVFLLGLLIQNPAFSQTKETDGVSEAPLPSDIVEATAQCQDCKSLDDLAAFARATPVSRPTNFVVAGTDLLVQKAPISLQSAKTGKTPTTRAKSIVPTEFGAKPLSCPSCTTGTAFLILARANATANHQNTSYYIFNEPFGLAARIRVTLERDVIPGEYFALAIPLHSMSTATLHNEYRRLKLPGNKGYGKLVLDPVALPTHDEFGNYMGHGVASRVDIFVSPYLGRLLNHLAIGPALVGIQVEVTVKFPNGDTAKYKFVTPGTQPFKFMSGTAHNSAGQPLNDSGGPVNPPTTTGGSGGGTSGGTHSGGGTWNLQGFSNGVIRGTICAGDICWIVKIFV